jgi:eukaryotic-like serine/threonine-protein kinase
MNGVATRTGTWSPTSEIRSGDTPSGSLDGRNPVVLIAGAGPTTTGGVVSLLRRRLGTFAVIIAALIVTSVLTEVTESLYGAGRPGRPPKGMFVPAGVFILATAIAWRLLGDRRPLSLRRLRAAELLLFGSLAVVVSWAQHRYFRTETLVEFYERGVVSEALVSPICLNWVFLILSYGIFIPNTLRRCVVIVAAMVVGPMALAVFDLSRNAWPTCLVLELLWDMELWLVAGAAIAIFGSHRLGVLEREVREARELGQYRLTRHLGSGGMGEVYLAEHVLLRRPCAIKLIRPERAGDARDLRRFEREVQATARLTHWNTVEIYDYGNAEDGTFYYAMEYLPGLSLQELVDRHGPLPPERAIHLLRQVCYALREAHGAGLIHRDIKPSNILACERGGVHDVAKLLDFGLVHADGPEGRDVGLSQEGSIRGTPSYMSPEQAAGEASIDARTDIYSLGAVAYFLLTGRPPFVRDTAMRTLAAHIHLPPSSPTELRPDLPDDLAAVVLRCLAKDPAGRPPSAEALEEALAGCRDAGRWTERDALLWWRSRGEPETSTVPAGRDLPTETRF